MIEDRLIFLILCGPQCPQNFQMTNPVEAFDLLWDVYVCMRCQQRVRVDALTPEGKVWPK